jgi:hypothetical protein
METPTDALRPSVLCLSADDVASIKQEISLGLLPPDWFQQCEEARAKNTFGADYKRDRHGRPIEQGIGSLGNESLNHFHALKKNEMAGTEPQGAYDRAVARLWKENPEHAKKIGLPRGE